MATAVLQSCGVNNGVTTGVAGQNGDDSDGSDDRQPNKRHPRDLPADKQDDPEAENGSDPDRSWDSDINNLDKWPITSDVHLMDGVWKRYCSKERKHLARELFAVRDGRYCYKSCDDCHRGIPAAKRTRRAALEKAYKEVVKNAHQATSSLSNNQPRGPATTPSVAPNATRGKHERQTVSLHQPAKTLAISSRKTSRKRERESTKPDAKDTGREDSADEEDQTAERPIKRPRTQSATNKPSSISRSQCTSLVSEKEGSAHPDANPPSIPTIQPLQPKEPPPKKSSRANKAVEPEMDYNSNIGHKGKELHEDPKNPSKRYLSEVQNWKAESGLVESLPPMTSTDEIIAVMVGKIIGLITQALGYIKRELRFGTVCSGTDAPLFVSRLISEELRKRGVQFDVRHLFSFEIVPYKQHFIEINYDCEVIFRDITEFLWRDIPLGAAFELTTVYGAQAPVPGPIDILVAGTACVDLSNLNSNAKGLEAGGESGDTFDGTIELIKHTRPRVAIFENVVNKANWDGMKARMTQIDYECIIERVDTKNFGLPQTRNRCYMICFDAKLDLPIKLNLVKAQVKEIFLKLQRPASSPVQSFLLEADDPLLLSTQQHETVKVRANKWIESVKRHTDSRYDLLMVRLSRCLTNWNVKLNIPDHMIVNVPGRVNRTLDWKEIAHARAVYRGYDDRYYGRMYNVSQNIDREADNIGQGLTGCIAPHSSIFCTARGSRLIGLETLILQGLDPHRLDIQGLTNSEIHDMGGNAMTVPVVGAVILCAIVAGYELFGQGTQQEPPRPGLDMHDVVNEDTLVFDTFSLTTYASLDVHTAIYLATSTARLCVCEGRQSNKRAKFQKCKVCGHSTCTDCGGNPEHQYQPIVLARGDPYNYQQLLKESLPMLITFVNLCSSDPSSFLDGLYNEHQERIDAERWLMIKPALVGALSHEVCFRSIMRRVEWEILYDSQYAVLRLTISAHGVSWRLFAKADPESAVNDPARKYLEEFPFASSHPEEGDIVEGPWEFWLPQELKVPATITGVGKLRQSYATKVGLTLHLSTYILSAYLVEAVKSLPGAKSEEWEGLYQSHPECGQAFDSLHVQVASSPLPRPLYFFLDHHRMAGDPKDHQYVFTHDTKRSKYGEARERRARLESWRPQVFHGLPMPPTESMTYKPVKSESTERFTESKLLEVIKPEHVNVVMDGTWTSIPNTLKCSTVENKFRFGHLPADPGNFDSCGLKYVIFDCQAPIGAHLAGSWPREEWFSVNSFNEDRFFKEFLWVFQRALYNPQHQEDGPFHQLDVAIVDYADCAPSPPTRKWAIGTDGKLVPFEDPEEAAQYERVMKRQARPINLYAKIDEKGLFNFKVAITPAILCQKSRATLGGRNTKIDKCEWRLTTDHNRERVEKSENFTYTDTTDELLAPEPLVWTEDPKLRLKDVQRRILSWTTGMETRPKIFREQHRHEARHDQTGTRLDGQITIYKTIRSIIVSFSAGGGKTPLSLAHIIIMRDRISPLKQRPGFISITATIIFVPTHLTKQWLSEIKKFLPTLYAEHGKVILLETMADLLNTTVGDFMKAEIIIVNIKLLADDDYLLRLATFSGVMPCSDKAGTRATEDWYLDALRNLNDSVEQLKKDPSDFQKYAETKYATSKAKFEKVVAFAASMRLRGKAYMKEKNKRKQLPKQEKEKVVKEAKPRPKIESGLANLESLKGPPLQMFFYQRLIHDEFTYTKGISYLAIRHAEAVFKMHLSATPDCSTPAAVNTYSLLGGITVCPISFETLQKQDELTQAEIFLGKGPEKSAAMQAFYHTKSQEFIDLCMRVDVVDKSEQTWKIKEQELMVHMRPSERLTYQEIVQSLNDARFQLALTNSPTDLHSVRQIYNAIGRPGISNQRKALVSTSAYSMLRLRRGSRLYDKEDALLSIERLRQRELEDLLNDLQSDMFDALVLHSDNATHSSLQDKDDPHRAATRYQNHSDCQDPDADKFFKEAIISAWHRFTDEGPHFGTKFKDWDTEEKVKAIKQAMSRIQGKVDRVRDAVRSHRIFFNGHLMERAQSNLSIEGLCVCSKCGRDLMDASPHLQYRLLTACGHLVCVECLNRSFEEIKDCCPVDNCRLINEAYQQLSSLRAPHNTVKDSHEPCSPTVIEIVKTIIQFPEGDNVVIFAQFPAQLSNVAHYLEPYGIVCWNLETARDPAGVLQAFQNRTEFVPGEGIARVLLLRIDDDTAAGGNITSANRIIFFAPYYTEGKGAQRLYDSAVRQALARVARTGQCKSKIFVYRFMAALTIEVDLFERRTHTRANYAPYRSGFADEFFDVEEAVEDVVDEVAMEN